MEPRSSPGPASAGPGARAGRPAASDAGGPRTGRDGEPLEPWSCGPGLPGAGAVVPEVIVADRRWHALVRGSGRVVARAARLGGGAGSIVLTTDRAVRRLNARHRGQNHATNVLTFEAGPGTDGDIVLAFGVVRREAAAARRTAAHHLAHLVLHGALHLRGHDHHGAGEARRMELREAWLLHRMGVPNPWRAGGRAGASGAGASGAAQCDAAAWTRGGAAAWTRGVGGVSGRAGGLPAQGPGVLSGGAVPGLSVARGAGR